MVTECQITLKLLKTFDPFQATGFSQYVLKTPGFLTFPGGGGVWEETSGMKWVHAEYFA